MVCGTPSMIRVNGGEKNIEKHGENLTLAILWLGQASRFAKWEVCWGQIWEEEICCAVHVLLYLKLYKYGGNIGRIYIYFFFFLWMLTSQIHASDQTEDHRLKGAAWNVDKEAILVQQNWCNV